MESQDLPPAMRQLLDQQLINDGAEDLAKLTKTYGQFHFVCSFHEVVLLISQLQVALKHPHCIDPGRQDVLNICDSLIGFLEKEAPRLGAMLRRGYDSDVAQWNVADFADYDGPTSTPPIPFTPPKGSDL